MKYQRVPYIGTRTNQLIVYHPGDAYDKSYKTEFPLPQIPQGAQHWFFDSSQQTKLPPELQAKYVTDFDACADHDAYTRNCFRGRRRDHVFQLAANYRNAPVSTFQKWFGEVLRKGFAYILDLLRTLCKGDPSYFSDPSDVWFSLDQDIKKQLDDCLEDIHKRTFQILILNTRENETPVIPEWSCINAHDLYGFYTHNDWEIIAATYRAEVETFLQASEYLGYDFKPPFY
jgi:hypothetical protein